MLEEPASPPSLNVSLESTAEGLFFIVGSGRCGSTLLQVMLDSHSQFAIPGESFFYDDFRRRNLWRYRTIDNRQKMDRVLRHALRSKYVKVFGLDDRRAIDFAATGEPSWETIFLSILSAFREQRGAARVGEKTPGHVNYLWYLYEAFPDAKFIHIIRDPRAVVASFLEADFYQKARGGNPWRAIKWWMDAVDRHFEAIDRADSSRYLSLRYEDLVKQPCVELRKVCDFLGVPFENSMMAFYERDYSGYMESEVHKSGTYKPVYQDSLGQWRSKLSPTHLQLVEALLCERMERLGYPCEVKRVPFWARLKFQYLYGTTKGRAVRTRLSKAVLRRG